MWALLLMALVLVATPSVIGPNFFEPYQRGCNIVNPANRYNPHIPFAPLNRSR